MTFLTFKMDDTVTTISYCTRACSLALEAPGFFSTVSLFNYSQVGTFYLIEIFSGRWLDEPVLQSGCLIFKPENRGISLRFQSNAMTNRFKLALPCFLFRCGLRCYLRELGLKLEYFKLRKKLSLAQASSTKLKILKLLEVELERA